MDVITFDHFYKAVIEYSLSIPSVHISVKKGVDFTLYENYFLRFGHSETSNSNGSHYTKVKRTGEFQKEHLWRIAAQQNGPGLARVINAKDLKDSAHAASPDTILEAFLKDSWDLRLKPTEQRLALAGMCVYVANENITKKEPYARLLNEVLRILTGTRSLCEKTLRLGQGHLTDEAFRKIKQLMSRWNFFYYMAQFRVDLDKRNEIGDCQVVKLTDSLVFKIPFDYVGCQIPRTVVISREQSLNSGMMAVTETGSRDVEEGAETQLNDAFIHFEEMTKKKSNENADVVLEKLKIVEGKLSANKMEIHKTAQRLNVAEYDMKNSERNVKEAREENKRAEQENEELSRQLRKLRADLIFE